MIPSHLVNKCNRCLLTSYWLAAALIILIISLDAATKFWVQGHLANSHYSLPIYPYGGIGVFKDILGIEFALTHTTNRGAAWGMLADYHIYLFYVRIFLIGALVVFTIFYNKHPEWRIPLSLIIAGAVGNIIDFFLYQHVIDMFHFTFWGYQYPVFNIADSAIFIGICWLFLASTFTNSPSKKL